MKRALWLCPMMLVLLGGCVADESANPNLDGCTTDADCAAGETCYRGFCVGGGMDGGGMDGGPACPAALLCWEGADPEHRGVGACRLGCEVDGECVGWVESTTETCNRVDDDCDGMVDEGFDLTTEESCGECGRACDAGLMCCGGGCSDVGSDEDNCGGCGRRCDEGDVCCGGACVALGDEVNCAACGDACGAGELCCDGRCADVTADAANCGSCDRACTGGTPECCGSDCRPSGDDACTMCLETCGGDDPACCSGTCRDLESNPLHCGACGNACEVGQLCCGGACIDQTAANCGACGTSCEDGSLCCPAAGGCDPNDGAHCGDCETTCDSGESCCSNTCVTTASSPDHCGSCGSSCGPAPLRCCGGACVNTDTDDNNCGSCGNSCVLGCNGSGRCNLF